MVQVKVSELSGIALDWAVAKCEGFTPGKREWGDSEGQEGMELIVKDSQWPMLHTEWNPSTNWSIAGPIIEREGISTEYDSFSKDWCCRTYEQDSYYYGPTPLIAAMRCYVSSRIGDVVEIPIDLLGNE